MSLSSLKLILPYGVALGDFMFFNIVNVSLAWLRAASIEGDLSLLFLAGL
jgi:hypothetical protein